MTVKIRGVHRKPCSLFPEALILSTKSVIFLTILLAECFTTRITPGITCSVFLEIYLYHVNIIISLLFSSKLHYVGSSKINYIVIKGT